MVKLGDELCNYSKLVAERVWSMGKTARSLGTLLASSTAMMPLDLATVHHTDVGLRVAIFATVFPSHRCISPEVVYVTTRFTSSWLFALDQFGPSHSHLARIRWELKL